MNKKFSTLMASVLLASAFSTTAYAALDPKPAKNKVEKGQVVALFTENTATNVISLNPGTKELGTKTAATVFDGSYGAAGFDDVRSSLWKVASLKYDQVTGVGIYQFVNKATGEYLAIDLVTDNKGTSNNQVKTSGAGNKDWCLTDNGEIYTVSGDSIYSLKVTGTALYLEAEKGGVNELKAGAQAVYIASLEIANGTAIAVKPYMELTYKGFNDLMKLQGHSGKLHFNNKKNVSDGQDNVLTAKTWKAYLAGTPTSKKFFLADTSDSTEVNKNPYLLMVDKAQYAPAMDQFFKLVTDTLSIDRKTVKDLVANELKLDATVANLDLVAGGGTANVTYAGVYNHPVATAQWSAAYHFTNDSLVLSVAGVPDKIITTDFALTDGTNAWSDFGSTAVAGAADANSKASLVPVYKKIVDLGGTVDGKITALKTAVDNWITEAVLNAGSAKAGFKAKFAETEFTAVGAVETSAGSGTVANVAGGVLTAAQAATGLSDAEKAFVKAVEKLERKTVAAGDVAYFIEGMPSKAAAAGAQEPMIAELMGTKVLTVAAGPTYPSYIKPFVQPFATEGGDATITTGTKFYRIQIANTAKDAVLKATADNGKYLVATGSAAAPFTTLVESVDDANVYAQWAFVQGTSGYYQVINRGSKYQLYAGPVSKVKDAAGNVVEDAYVFGTDTVKLASVSLSTNEFEDKEGDKTVKYDYSGYFYAGPTKDKSYTFAIAPVAAIMNDLGAQFNKDSVMVLGKAEDAPVWYFEEAGAVKYGLEIEGVTPLKYMTYKIFTKDANGDSLYVYEKNNKYYVTNKGAAPATFSMREVSKGQYLFLDGANKMTINPTPAQPVLEASAVATMRDDYFTIASASSNAYRTLTEEDGVLGNAKIFMNNEPYRYLYENTANIVANNGNAIAKDSLNFLGIYNAAASSKNAAIYVDTAYVNRKGVTMPQYMFALGVEAHKATPAAPCTESGVHVGKDGKPTTADKCVHATPATKAYKTGRYLVSVADSASTAKHPAKYDGAFRLAFVEAIHVEGSDSLIIVNSKYTNNNKVITAGKATTYASKDTLKFENDKPNVATFALLIKDQADKSFYLETAGKTYVRILNGVPVLTDNIENAAIFNIEATDENATANEAIAAEGVQVIGGKGAVTVQGAAGKVITVANVLGQTIANQVAASDNVTIAAPAGVIVVAVEGEATKVVVK